MEKTNSTMFVFEGTECTGKSSIISYLAEKYSCPINKRVKTSSEFTRLQQVMNDISQQKINTLVAGSDKIVLFDRWQLVSDMIYSPYFGMGDSIFQSMYHMLLQECKDCNIVFVHVKADDHVIRQRIEERGDRLVMPQQACTLGKFYNIFFAVWKDKMNYEEIDTTRLGKVEAIKLAESIVEKYTNKGEC